VSPLHDLVTPSHALVRRRQPYGRRVSSAGRRHGNDVDGQHARRAPTRSPPVADAYDEPQTSRRAGRDQRRQVPYDRQLSAVGRQPEMIVRLRLDQVVRQPRVVASVRVARDHVTYSKAYTGSSRQVGGNHVTRHGADTGSTRDPERVIGRQREPEMRRVVVDVIDPDHHRRFVRPVHVRAISGSGSGGVDGVNADGESMRRGCLAIERRARHDDTGVRVDSKHGRVELVPEVGERRRVAVNGDDNAREGTNGHVLRQSEAVSRRDEPWTFVVYVEDREDHQGV